MCLRTSIVAILATGTGYTARIPTELCGRHSAAGLANAGNGNYGMGVAIGGYDNDGYPDLYVTSYGKNILYHNNGDVTFTDVTAKAGVAGEGWSVSAGFVDYDNDGHLDLFVTRYMDWDADHNKICGGDWHTYCPRVHSQLLLVCCTTIVATAPSKMSASVQESPPKKGVLLVWRLRTTTATVSPMLPFPTTACSNIFSTTTVTALSRGARPGIRRGTDLRQQRSVGDGYGVSGL